MIDLQDIFPTLPPLMFAIGVHGLGHILAARASGIRMQSLRRTSTGFRLVASQAFVSYDAELLCALGGPAANAIAALICRMISWLWPSLGPTLSPLIPHTLYLGLFNLLPIEGFDGARIFRCWFCARKRSCSLVVADRLIAVSSCGCLLLFWLLALYLLLRCGSALSLYLFCLQLFEATTKDMQNKRNHEHS